MIFLLTYILLPFNLLNLVDKPIEVDNNKDQIYVIISGPSCHECLLHVGEWTSRSKMEITAVIWYNKTIIQKKEQIKFYKQYLTPKTWTFSKDLDSLSYEFNLKISPNLIVVKDGKIYYFRYEDLFSENKRVDEFNKLIGN